MKKPFRSLPALGLLLAALLPAATAHAFSDTVTWAQSYGVASFGSVGNGGAPDVPSDDGAYGPGGDTPTSIAPMPDGGVVVAGQLDLPYALSYHTGDNAPAALVRYDRSGGIVWQTVLRQDNDRTDTDGTFHLASSKVLQIRTDAAGNVYILGGRGNADNFGKTPFVAKFSPAGALLWQNGFESLAYYTDFGADGKRLDQGQVTVQPSLGLTRDGGVVICAGAFVAVNASVPYLAKFNGDGTLAFHREYTSPHQFSGALAVCQRPDAEGFVVLLPPSDAGGPQGGYQFTAMLTDAAGNPVLQRSFYGDSYEQPSFFGPTQVVPSDDGTLLILCSSAYAPSQGVNVRKLRRDLTPVWAKVIFYSQPAFTLAPVVNGGCILGSRYAARFLTLDTDGVLHAVSLLGSSEGEGDAQVVGAAGSPMAICQSADGAVAFTIATLGYRTGLAKPDWWVVKARPFGGLPGFADVMQSLPLTDFPERDSNEAPSEVTGEYGPPPTNEADPAVVPFSPGLILENAANETGTNKPTIKFQAAPVTSSGRHPFFYNEFSLGNGAYYLKVFESGKIFGYYSYLSDEHYIYHFDLGYEYVSEATDFFDGVYLYDFKSGGFFYTSPSFPFPYLYDFSLGTTLYYFPDPANPGRYNTNGVRYFIRLDTGEIISK